LAGRTFGQLQLTTFLSTGQVVNPNPAWLQVPIAEISDLSCLHYPEPQTGQAPNPSPHLPGDGDCPHLAIDDKGGWLPAVALPATVEAAHTSSGAGPKARVLPATGAPNLPLPLMAAAILLVGGLLRASVRRRA
jgi:LPXTG-motif cell wall-anchored protein